MPSCGMSVGCMKRTISGGLVRFASLHAPYTYDRLLTNDGAYGERYGRVSMAAA